MDVSLLHGDGSDSSDSDGEKKSRGKWRRKLSAVRHVNVFKSPSNAVTGGDKYERAAAMVDLVRNLIHPEALLKRNLKLLDFKRNCTPLLDTIVN